MKRVFVSVFFVLVAMIVNAQDIARTLGWNLEYSGREIKACFSCFPFRGFMDGSTMDSPDQGAKGIPTGKNGVRR